MYNKLNKGLIHTVMGNDVCSTTFENSIFFYVLGENWSEKHSEPAVFSKKLDVKLHDV